MYTYYRESLTSRTEGYVLYAMDANNVRITAASVTSKDLEWLLDYADFQEENGRKVQIVNGRDELVYETGMRWESPVPRPTAEPELVENIMRLLDIKDLVRETRPAYRARIQHLKSHRYEVEAMTPDQALALFHVLDKLPYDDSIDYMAWIVAFDSYGPLPPTDYEVRCAETIADAAVAATNDLGMNKVTALLATAY